MFVSFTWIAICLFKRLLDVLVYSERQILNENQLKRNNSSKLGLWSIFAIPTPTLTFMWASGWHIWQRSWISNPHLRTNHLYSVIVLVWTLEQSLQLFWHTEFCLHSNYFATHKSKYKIKQLSFKQAITPAVGACSFIFICMAVTRCLPCPLPLVLLLFQVQQQSTMKHQLLLMQPTQNSSTAPSLWVERQRSKWERGTAKPDLILLVIGNKT